MLGAAGIVAGGYALTCAADRDGPGPDAPVPVQAPPVPTSEQRWVARAQVTVTSLDQQLELIARTEQALAAAQRPADPPPVALDERKAC